MHNYDSPLQAAAELVDNAVDNRKPGQPLTIRIRVTREELSIANIGGLGIDDQGLDSYFHWGESESAQVGDRIGTYGVGGKGAAGYLGTDIEITGSANGSDEESHVVVPNWETRQGELKVLEVETRKATAKEGYFRLRIKGLKRQISTEALVQRLGRTYRPLLLEGSVVVTVNNKTVEPMEIPYMQTEPDLRPQLYSVATRFSQEIPLYVGVLLAPVPGLKPGLILYYRGREISDGQLFGMPNPAQMPGMARFIGQAHLDFVPVTTNKSGFDTGSPYWIEVARRLETALKPWVEKVAKLKVEVASPIEKYDRDVAREAFADMLDVFASTGLVTKAMLPNLAGGAVGRTPPKLRHEPPGGAGHSGGSGPKEGQTPPSAEATIGEMPRWSPVKRIEPRSLGFDGRPADIVKEGDANVLVINSDYPPYKIAKDHGVLRFYVVETSLRRVAREREPDNLERYVDLAESLIRDAGLKQAIRMKRQKGLADKRAERVKKRTSLRA